MKYFIAIVFSLQAVSLGFGDVSTWLHDVSVRIALQSWPSRAQELPWPLEQPFPDYPEKWRGQGVTGEATLRLTVAADGRISDIRVLKSSQKEFGEAAVAATKRWKFKPGFDRERNAAIAFQLEYLFLFERHDR